MVKLTPVFLVVIATSTACGGKKAGPEKATEVTEEYLEGLNGHGILGGAYQAEAFLESFERDNNYALEHCDMVNYAWDELLRLGPKLADLPAKPPGLDQCTKRIRAAVTTVVNSAGALPPCQQFGELWPARNDAFEKALCDLRSARDVCAAEAKAAKATTVVDKAEFCYPVESRDPLPPLEGKAPAQTP